MERAARSRHGFRNSATAVQCLPFGYNGYMNGSHKKMHNFFDFAPLVLIGLVSVLVTLGLTLLYCSLSTEMKQLSHVKRVMKYLTASLLVIFIYITTFSITEAISALTPEKQTKATEYVIFFIFFLAVYLEKNVIIVGYLLAFHFTKVWDTLKTFCSKKKKEKLAQKSASEYGTFKESDRISQPSETCYSVQYTNEFTTV